MAELRNWRLQKPRDVEHQIHTREVVREEKLPPEVQEAFSRMQARMDKLDVQIAAIWKGMQEALQIMEDQKFELSQAKADIIAQAAEVMQHRAELEVFWARGVGVKDEMRETGT
jgi:hypothetical protein